MNILNPQKNYILFITYKLIQVISFWNSLNRWFDAVQKKKNGLIFGYGNKLVAGENSSCVSHIFFSRD
jgi:hypothetical protein